jgi:tetratricopeptide (TPR) repeat protein
LQALLDWDYELLDDDERWLLASLAVFAGGFTVEAVEKVCAGDISHLDALEGLITKSLIRPDEEVLDEVRLTMMNTVRAYALSKLDERGDLDELMGRHAAHYRGVMEEAAPHLQGHHGDRYIRMLRRERHNLRAARLWYSNGDDAEGELRYLAALSPFLSLVGVLSEAQSFLETALSRRRDAPEELRAPVLVEAGSIALEQGEFKRATAFLEEGIDILRRARQPVALGDALRRLGNVSLDRGDFEKARRLYEESIGLHRGAGNEIGVALALNNLGVITIRTGDADAAAPLYEEAMGILRRHGVRRPMVSMLINLGEVSFERGRIEDADAYLREAFDVLRADGALWDVAYTLELMAPVCAAKGDARLGAVLFGAAEGLREAVGTPLPPSEQERYSRHVAIVREALGPGEFDAALTEGREMPPGDVLRLV